jgi:integrase
VPKPSKRGDLTFLVNEWGRPFTDAGFGNWFRDRCVEAGVPGRAHGLRKAGATIAANNGATSQQLMAIFGWDTLKEAERYTRGADQLRLSAHGARILCRLKMGDEPSSC